MLMEKSNAPKESLADFRQDKSRQNTFLFMMMLLSLFTALLYVGLNEYILIHYPDAGVHGLVTLHKGLAVGIFMLFTEIFLIALERWKDNYMARYSDERFPLLDKINDFYAAKPSTRLWLKFAYFALRFYCATLLASGNLI